MSLGVVNLQEVLVVREYERESSWRSEDFNLPIVLKLKMNYNLTEVSAIYSPSLTIIIIIKQMNGQYSIFSPGDPRA
jgi:hypothetical protein